MCTRFCSRALRWRQQFRSRGDVFEEFSSWRATPVSPATPFLTIAWSGRRLNRRLPLPRRKDGLLQQVKDFYSLEYTNSEEISYEAYEKNNSFSIRILQSTRRSWFCALLTLNPPGAARIQC